MRGDEQKEKCRCKIGLKIKIGTHIVVFRAARMQRHIWNYFFESKSDTKTNLYAKKGTTFEQYMAGWQDFKNSLQDRDGLRMNLLLKSKDSYSK